MTPRVLFNVIFKILGLFFLKDCLLVLSSIISAAFYYTTNKLEAGFLAGYLVSFFLYAYLFYFLVFNTNWFIDKLKIEKDFGKEEIPLNIHRSTV